MEVLSSLTPPLSQTQCYFKKIRLTCEGRANMSYIARCWTVIQNTISRAMCLKKGESWRPRRLRLLVLNLQSLSKASRVEAIPVFNGCMMLPRFARLLVFTHKNRGNLLLQSILFKNKHSGSKKLKSLSNLKKLRDLAISKSRFTNFGQFVGKFRAIFEKFAVIF